MVLGNYRRRRKPYLAFSLHLLCPGRMRRLLRANPPRSEKAKDSGNQSSVPLSRCPSFAGQLSLQAGPSPPPSRTTPSLFLLPQPHPLVPQLQRQCRRQAICLTSSSTPWSAKSYSLRQSLFSQRRLSNCQATHCWPITELRGDVMVRAEQWC